MTDHADIVADYIDGVMTGRIVAGRLVKLAVQRQLDDLKHGGERGLYFDKDVAWEACEFFPSHLQHYIGEWASQPFTLTPFQTFFVWTLFGWRKEKNRFRRFRKVYLTVARKFGKTSLCGGLALYGATTDDPIEQGAEIYCAATKEDQAKIMFRDASEYVKASPLLSPMSTVLTNNIAFPSLSSFIRPLGSDSKTNAGWKPHYVMLDEVCDWQEHHRGLWGALTTAMGNRRQPLRVVTCTAGDETSEIWLEEDVYAQAVVESVLTGKIVDDAYFAMIARLDEARPCDKCDGHGCDDCVEGTIPADDVFDERNWPKANPNLGHTIQLDYLQDQANEARQKPSALKDFKRYHCNIRVTSSFKVIDTAGKGWLAGGRELSDWSGQSVYGAFDLGWSSDLASIALATKFFDGQDDSGNDRWRYEVRSWSFICEDCPQNLTSEPWAAFVRDGCLTVTRGNVTDIPGAFKRKIVEVTNEFNVIQWAHDTSGALHLAIELNSELGIECFKFPQTHNMYTPAFKLYLDLISAGLFVHGGDRLLEWTARNLVANENHMKKIMPDKQKSKEKIDPQTATIMAIGGAMTGVESRPWSREDGVFL